MSDKAQETRRQDMGLDMYVKASVSISEFDVEYPKSDTAKQEAIQALSQIRNIPSLPEIFKTQRSFMLEATVAQWRKSNQIHKWFVDNIQSGVDECQTVYLSRENIQKLIDLCSKVIKYPTIAHELLPTGEGFFFGGTEYDDYYFRDVKDTIKMLTPLLGDEYKNCFFSYTSSW